MDSRKTLPYKSHSDILRLIQVKRADEATRFVDSVDFDFDIPLHESTGSKVVRFYTKGFALF